MVIYSPYPDSVVCNNNIIQPPDPFVETFHLETINPLARTIVYYSHGGADMSYDMDTGDWVAGNSDYDCSMVNLTDLLTEGTSTPRAVAYGEQIIVQPAGLSTDPVQAVLLAAIIMLLSATYVRRVFFS